MIINFEAALYDQLSANNLEIIGQINFTALGLFQRFPLKTRPHKGSPIFVVIHPGDGASFGNWQDRTTWHTWWFKSHQQASIKERKARKLVQLELERERQKIKDQAIKSVPSIWANCKPLDKNHPYLLRKKITPFNARQLGARIVVPIQNIQGKLISLQFIFPDGPKQFKKDARAKEGFVILGDFPGDNAWICEGWATGCTIHELTNLPVICALSAYNLIPVSILLRRHFIHTKYCMAADNDEAGLKSAREIHSSLKIPIFYPSQLGMDFNDVFVSAGRDAVMKDLLTNKDFL